MNLITKMLEINTESQRHYDTLKYNYRFSLLEVNIDLFVFYFSFTIAYWFTRESHYARIERINAMLHEFFQDSHAEEEPKPKRKYVKKEVKKAGRPKKK